MDLKLLLFGLLFLTNCYTDLSTSSKHNTSYNDSLAIIDTSYIDPISKHIKPPCSSSPDYCGCIKSHIKASNINITFKCNP